MSDQPNISQILAALAQAPGATMPQPGFPQQHPPPQPPPQAQPPPSYAPQYPSNAPLAAQPPGNSAFNLPQPIGSGSIDLSSIKPVNSGSVSVLDAVGRARELATNGYRDHETPPRNRRSRSRSPTRLNPSFNGNYNSNYRDERYDDPRRPVVVQYGHERNFSPDLRAAPPGARFVTPPVQDYSSSSGDPNSEVIPVASKVVGLIIGRQGENLKHVETDTGTRVQFITGPQESSPMRQCRITGPKHAREAAKEEIYRIIEENGNPTGGSAPARAPLPVGRDVGTGSKMGGNHQPALRAGEESSQIMVPNRTVGLIIGRGGETIRDLQERSGCHVNIVGEDKSINGLRPVNLIGTAPASAMAKELIMEIVDSDTKSQANNQSNAAIRDHRQMPAHGIGSGEKINDQIFVPSEAVGMIIGKGGETIKNMQNDTGCKINVSPASGQDVEREIGLIGTRDAIERAKNAIMEKVHAVHEKNTRSNGGGGAGNGHSFSQVNQQPYVQRNPQAQSSNGASPSGEVDPYAAYGGYDNYVAMWYASQMQQQQQNPQGPPGS